MADRATPVPLFIILLGAGAFAMLVPAAHALAVGDLTSARPFFHGAILFSFLALLLALATWGRVPRADPWRQLVTLLGAFTVLPAMFALPFQVALGSESFLHAWFEMVSSFTTTGATLYKAPHDLPPSLHLWRALVAWLGGLLIWVVAMAIFAPMNLGGFEVRAAIPEGSEPDGLSPIIRVAPSPERLRRHSARLAMIYAALTGLLWLGLLVLGEAPLVALCHAMSVLATSGISPTGGLAQAQGGIWAEMLIFVFFVFALSRLTFGRGLPGEDWGSFWRDPELRLGLLVIGGMTILLFLRHWLAGAGAADPLEALAAFWGTLFTVASFLTTTGFESRAWSGATLWSGLETPGLILLGLALFGGGIATTAGGVKLLRIHALYKHGLRGLERLVHPSSVGGAGAQARQIRGQGARIAWIFLMLFALSIAVIMALLALTGISFETALVLTVAGLTTTGPLAAVAAEAPISYAAIPEAAQIILAGAMILGRLELLAIIALLNPDAWRP